MYSICRYFSEFFRLQWKKSRDSNAVWNLHEIKYDILMNKIGISISL